MKKIFFFTGQYLLGMLFACVLGKSNYRSKTEEIAAQMFYSNVNK